MADPVLVAIDTGGTFTDIVFLRNGRMEMLKVLSTPDDPGRAVLDGLRQVRPDAAVVVRHGTTVATNAMLERKGARVAFVTTSGFEDTIAIGRQARPKLYDWFQPAPQSLVPDALRFGVAERVGADAKVLLEVSDEELRRLIEAVRASGAEAVAVSTLFSFAQPVNEEKIAAALGSLDLPLSISHRILPEFREYERASTIVANAYVAPKVGSYLQALARGLAAQYPAGRLEVMQSSGGILAAGVAAAEPVRTMLSGPAGGVIGAYKLARLAGFERIIGFDMGGTSTDVCLVDETGPHISTESIVTGIPIGVPMLDIHTAGAGGGSIARLDAGGLLRVGPESAGAMPGPICFGRGGTKVTVTDANLVLGRFGAGEFGTIALDEERARLALADERWGFRTAEALAEGVLRVVETSMENAIRLISVDKGYDPRDFTLVAFGGGGPLHACSLARRLSVPRVMVPVHPGALSAVGILLADTAREYSRTVMVAADADLHEAFAELEALGAQDLPGGAAIRSVDVRYVGQGYELNVPFGEGMREAFDGLHQRRYGFADAKRAVEVVNIRIRMVAEAAAYEVAQLALRTGGAAQSVGLRQMVYDGAPHAFAVYRREDLMAGDAFAGPAMICEYSSTTIVPPGDHLRVDSFGNLVIEVNG